MANSIGQCFTPTSLWNELKKMKVKRVILFIEKKNPYDIDSVTIRELKD